MNKFVRLENRCRTRTVCLKTFRRAVLFLVNRVFALQSCDLFIALVGDDEMTRLNETLMRHAGTTDVITLDYGVGDGGLAGEIYICVPEARRQARRFNTPFQQELARYAVHGMLHMSGYDDQKASDRRKMKARENACLRALAEGARIPSQRLRRSRTRLS